MAQLNLMLDQKLNDESWDPVQDISANNLARLVQRMANTTNQSFQAVVYDLFAQHCPFVHVENTAAAAAAAEGTPATNQTPAEATVPDGNGEEPLKPITSGVTTTTAGTTITTAASSNAAAKPAAKPAAPVGATVRPPAVMGVSSPRGVRGPPMVPTPYRPPVFGARGVAVSPRPPIVAGAVYAKPGAFVSRLASIPSAIPIRPPATVATVRPPIVTSPKPAPILPQKRSYSATLSPAPAARVVAPRGFAGTIVHRGAPVVYSGRFPRPAGPPRGPSR